MRYDIQNDSFWPALSLSSVLRLITIPMLILSSAYKHIKFHVKTPRPPPRSSFFSPSFSTFKELRREYNKGISFVRSIPFPRLNIRYTLSCDIKGLGGLAREKKKKKKKVRWKGDKVVNKMRGKDIEAVIFRTMKRSNASSAFITIYGQFQSGPNAQEFETMRTSSLIIFPPLPPSIPPSLTSPFNPPSFPFLSNHSLTSVALFIIAHH